jgi:hypothetical protein
VEDAIAELAAYADVPGLDWAALNASGNGLVASNAYLEQGLEPLFQRYIAVIDSLDLTAAELSGTTTEEARSAWDSIWVAINKRAGVVLDAIAAGELRVAWNNAVQIRSDVLRRLVIASHAVSMDALGSHDTGMVRYAVESGQLSIEDAQADANDIARLWRGVILLNEQSALDSLKIKQGLGLAWFSAPVAFALVATITVIALCLTVVWTVSETNQDRREWCLDEQGSLRRDAPTWCREAPSSPLATFLGPVSAGAKSLGTALGWAIGLGAIAGLLVMRRNKQRNIQVRGWS